MIGETIIAVQPTGNATPTERCRKLFRTLMKMPEPYRESMAGPSISFECAEKRLRENTITLVAKLRDLIEQRRRDLPEGAELTAVNDYSVVLKETIGYS